MKRLLRILATLLALALVAAACGGDGDDDGSGDDASGSESADETDAGTDADDADADDGDGDDGEAMADGEGSIWVLLPDSATSDRWEKDDRRFFAEGFDAAGLAEGDDYSIVNAEGDAATQISQAEQAIGDGASVIVLTSNDSGSGATIIDLAKEAGVAVVEYDRFNTEGQGGDVYVSFDNVQVGATMAAVLEPAIDALGAEEAQICLLYTSPSPRDATLSRMPSSA